MPLFVRPERNPAVLGQKIVDFNFSEFINEFPDFFMRHYFMVGAWFVVLVMLIIVQFKLLTARLPKATSGQAVTLVNRNDGVFVDIRSSEGFAQGHIANSLNISASDIKSGKINRIDNYRDKPVILVGKDKFDSECFNSGRFLKKQGFNKVYILEGGILDWSSSNMPLSNKKQT